MHVDLDDPRVGTEEGEALFKEHGGNSAYLNHVTDALHVVHEGLASTPPLFAALDALGLVQPIEIEVRTRRRGILPFAVHVHDRQWIASWR